MAALAAACLALLVLVHVGAGWLRVLEGLPRSRWLSFGGGVAVAYVFVHLLPELAEADEVLADFAPLAALERHAHLAALAGVGLFYALDALAIASRRRRHGPSAAGPADDLTLWVHVAAFGAYNVLVGYLLAQRREEGAGEILLFTVGIAMHFVVADFGLRDHHRHRWDAVVRWVLAGALIAGFAAGALIELSEPAVALLIAFLAGGVILNTIKEEVPSERASRLGPFVIGAAVYAAILLAA